MTGQRSISAARATMRSRSPAIATVFAVRMALLSLLGPQEPGEEAGREGLRGRPEIAEHAAQSQAQLLALGEAVGHVVHHWRGIHKSLDDPADLALGREGAATGD